MFEARGVAATCTARVAAQLESRKDSSMVVAAGFSAGARPPRLLSLDVKTMFEARGVAATCTARVAA
jgi:hypothetical protein